MWYVNQGMERKTVTHLLPLNRYLCHEVVPGERTSCPLVAILREWSQMDWSVKKRSVYGWIVCIKSVILLFELVFGCFTFLKKLKSRSLT